MMCRALLLLLAFAPAAWAQNSQGPLFTNCSPSSECVGSGWTTPTNVATCDATYATWNETPATPLNATVLGFSLPANATVVGVKVYHEGNGNHANALARTIKIGLTKDGSTICGATRDRQYPRDNTNPFTTDGTFWEGCSPSTADCTSTDDMWGGCTLTASEVNATTFGIVWEDVNDSSEALRIDCGQVTVYYGVPAARRQIIFSQTRATRRSA